MVGTVVVSLDAELAWGYHDTGRSSEAASDTDGRLGDRLRTASDAVTLGIHHDNRLTDAELATARRSWRRLLDAFDEFGVPATWAVVGHLFLDACDGEHRSHPLSPAWFASDPGGSAADNPLWFGGGLIEAIEDAAVDHEIGSHSFSHVDFGAETTTPAVAAAEHRATDDAAAAHDLDPVSFVFPRNRLAHLDRLADHGYTCYRGTATRWYDGSPIRPAGKLATMLTQRSSPPISHPSVDDHGLVNVPASMDLFGFEGRIRAATRPIVAEPVVRQAKLGIERAIDEDGVFHLWFHPNDIQSDAQFERVRTVLEHVANRRDRGEIDAETMGGVARRVRNRSGAPRSIRSD